MGDSTVERRRRDAEWNNKSLVEKWKDAYHGRQTKQITQKSFYLCVFLTWYSNFTSLYTTLNYLIPFDYAGYSEDAIYVRKILAWFIFINSSAYWWCFQLYNTFHEKTADWPKRDEKTEMIYATIQDKLNSLQNQNGHKIKSQLNGYGHSHDGAVKINMESSVTANKPHPSLNWRFCHICDLPQPPRCHHCNICDKCVLKRDHHCYITGRCVGHYNQRYFVFLNFYGTLITYLTLTSSYRFLQEHFNAKDTWDYFLPFTFASWLRGEIQGHIFIMISHFYVISAGGVICAGFFFGQLFFILQGKTMFEATKMDDLVCTGSISNNFRSVFGNFWMLNFIFPAQLVYKQDSDGTTWSDLKLVTQKHKPRNHVKSYKETV